jgi:hypothetical protein
MANHVHLLVGTGTVPVATVMRRLLTGYAVTFNLRYGRHGPLFQNRYKSILCQKDPYLLELVRYIHLNPLRVRLVSGLKALETYAYCGHGVLMGRREAVWQDTDLVLSYFGRRVSIARRRYRDYVKDGLAIGQRPDLVGGGLIRSVGGWREIRGLKKGGERLKGDERILGDSRFVEEVLKISEEKYYRRERFRRSGYDLEGLAKRVGEVLGIRPEQIWVRGKYEQVVEGRSLLCYWAVRELGMRATELANKFEITQPAVSISVKRGERIANERGLTLPSP